MVFPVDYGPRRLGQGIDAGTGYRVLYGLSALIRPPPAGHRAGQLAVGWPRGSGSG